MEIGNIYKYINKQINGHQDYKTDPAQRAELVKIPHTRNTESLDVCR